MATATATADTTFLPVLPEDEFLHGAPEGRHYTAIETNYFGFHIPEHAIDGEVYMWFHTALDVMGVMIFVYQGHKRQQLAAEYFNHHDFLPMIADNGDYAVQMGSCSLKVKVNRPLEEIAFEIDDPRADFSAHWVSRAVAPPVGRPGGRHFTQLMRNEGKLTLRGEQYAIGDNFVRDRSWSQLRGEEPQAGPPACWITGMFGDDLAFHVSVLDTGLIDLPEFGPDWTAHMDKKDVLSSLKWESGGETKHINLRGGWWYDGQRNRQIVDAVKETVLEADGLNTATCRLMLTDDEGETHELLGRSITTLPKMYGQNLVVYLNQTVWEYRGRTGVGILETVYCNDHIYKLDVQRGQPGA